MSCEILQIKSKSSPKDLDHEAEMVCMICTVCETDEIKRGCELADYKLRLVAII